MNSLPNTGEFHPPKQARSHQTLNRIAQAALDLMEEEGVEGATVAEIVKRAKASIGSFYARFPGKEDLVRYLRTRVWTEARERWDHALTAQSWDGHSMDSVVEGVVSLLLRSLRADYHRRRVLGGDTSGDPEAAAYRLAFHRHILDTVTPLLMARRGDITHPEPEMAIRFGYHFVAGAIREFLELEDSGEILETGGGDSPEFGDASLTPGASQGKAPRGPFVGQSPELGRELARAWMAYLAPGSGEGTVEEEGAVDFFDPWG